MTNEQSPLRSATMAWIRQVVVKQNVCPFAKAVLENVRLRVHFDDHLEGLITLLADEVTHLMTHGPDDVPTTIVVTQLATDDFEQYLDIIAMTEDLVEGLGYADDVQVASFHPAYVFTDTDIDDPANWTNRSPYPMVHLLRTADVAHAIDTHPDVDGIPERNVALFRELGVDHVASALANCYSPSSTEQ